MILKKMSLKHNRIICVIVIEICICTIWEAG